MENTKKWFIPKIVKSKTYLAMADVFRIMSNMHSWREECIPSVHYNKENKEATTAFVFIFLAQCYEEKGGTKLDLDGIVWNMIRRYFRKALTWNISPDNKRALNGFFKSYEFAVSSYVEKGIIEKTSKSFFDFLIANSTKDEKTLQLFDAAKAIATLLEIYDLRETGGFVVSFRPKVQDVINNTLNQIQKFYEQFPFVREIIEKTGEYEHLWDLFVELNELRYIYRWQGYCIHNRSLSEHMIEALAFAALMYVEKHGTITGVSKIWKKLEVHDILEKYMGDYPGPQKNDVSWEGQTLRTAVEMLEADAFDRCVKPKLPAFIVERVRDMLNETEDHTDIKNADYFSADVEAFIEIIEGTNDKRYYIDVLRRTVKNAHRTPEMDKASRQMCKEARRLLRI